MHRVKSLELAQRVAAANHLHYGFCVTDGWYYLGTLEQLAKLPVVDVDSPTAGLHPQPKVPGPGDPAPGGLKCGALATLRNKTK